MFDDIYDNGAMILDKINNVINYLRKESDDIIEVDDLISDLVDIQREYYDAIVSINYDLGMGYSIDYWTYNDKVKNY